MLNSADFNVAQSRKRVFIIGFLRERCAGKVLSFTESNPKTLVKLIPGSEGNRVYSVDGLSITLTGTAGGFGGKTGLYEIMGLPIKVKTKSGYQIALPGDSIVQVLLIKRFDLLIFVLSFHKPPRVFIKQI